MTHRVSMMVAVASMASVVLGLAMMHRAQGEAVAGSPRVFEMRTYHAAEGKLEALHARFRDHTTALFVKHGMTSIGYWTPADGDTAKNTLVYILAYPSREAAVTAWKEFQADPAWVAAKTASEVNGKLVEKVDSVFMNPTDYSPIK
jgi:hypothetical protein